MDTPMRCSRLMILGMTLFSVLALSPVVIASTQLTEPEMTLLNQGANLDLNGSPLAARKVYDTLERKYPRDIPTVPSAINLFALNKLDQAWEYFTLIQKHGNNTDKEYASLWLALLYTKEKGKLPMGKDLDFLLPDIFLTPTRREIARMYRGDFPVEEFVQFINSTSDFARRDELTEIIFFTVGYLKYVMKDIDGAKKIFNENKLKLYSGSLERPLLEMGKP